MLSIFTSTKLIRDYFYVSEAKIRSQVNHLLTFRGQIISFLLFIQKNVIYGDPVHEAKHWHCSCLSKKSVWNTTFQPHKRYR